MKNKTNMSSVKERGPSAYNTAYDELPEYFSIFPPHMWLFLVEIVLMMLGGAMLVATTVMVYFSFTPEFYFFVLILFTGFMVVPNFMIVYGHAKGILYLRYLCVFYFVYSLVSVFLDFSYSALISIFVGLVVYWITTTQKFRLLAFQRIKMGEWRREQLEKNKIRRAVIKEQKQKEKLARAK